MMLQDHFRPPLSTRRHWHAFHNAWATYIASDLNTKLPEGYFAEPNVQFPGKRSLPWHRILGAMTRLWIQQTK
jgi:hypothetical protein